MKTNLYLTHEAGFSRSYFILSMMEVLTREMLTTALQNNHKYSSKPRASDKMLVMGWNNQDNFFMGIDGCTQDTDGQDGFDKQ